MPVAVQKNPPRDVLLEITKDQPSFRALRDPTTDDIYAWPASDALHVDMVNKLGLDFTTRDQLARSSYLFSREQVEQAPEARDLDDLVKIIGG